MAAMPLATVCCFTGFHTKIATLGHNKGTLGNNQNRNSPDKIRNLPKLKFVTVLFWQIFKFPDFGFGNGEKIDTVWGRKWP